MIKRQAVNALIDPLSSLADISKYVANPALRAIISSMPNGKGTKLLQDIKTNKALSEALEETPELARAWDKLDNLGRNQIKLDPDIVKAVKKLIDNPNVPSDKLDKIINRLAEAGTKCRTCKTPGKDGLRFMDDVLEDLDNFAKEFGNPPATEGFDKFLSEMGTKAGKEGGNKALGASWTLEALMRNRSKYFDEETITGFEVKHVPGKEFAADVVTEVGEFARYKEFKNWGSNLLESSNMIEQMAGTISTITRLEDMQFIFNPSRWVPTAFQVKTALQTKSSLFDDLMTSGKLQQLMPDEVILTTSDFIDNLVSPKYFDKVFKVQ